MSEERKVLDLSKVMWKVWDEFRSRNPTKRKEFISQMNHRLRVWFKELGDKYQIPKFKELALISDDELIMFLHLGFSEEHFLKTMVGDLDYEIFLADNPLRGMIPEGQHRIGS